MIELIDELISKLDAIKDAFLIGLLDAKKTECEDIKINILAEDIRELTWWAKSETKKAIPITYKVDKIEKLFETTFSCDKCPLSIETQSEYGGRSYTYKNHIVDSVVCKSCFRKAEKLESYQEEMKKEYEERIEKIVANEEIVDIIRMKSITRNINRKLKKL